MPHKHQTAIDEIKHKLGGKNPTCPVCGKEMFPEDDHGRFKRFSCPGMPTRYLANFTEEKHE